MKVSDEETLYRFECECNGEIPMGDGPTLKHVKRALLDYCRDAKRVPSVVMAELTAELMLSDSNDPLHVWIIKHGNTQTKCTAMSAASRGT